jgi:hypothetical protein
MSAIIFIIVINSTFRESRFVTIAIHTRVVIKSNLPASTGQVEISFYTAVETELSLNNTSEIFIGYCDHIITNSSPTESFNIDNKSKLDMIAIRVSNIIL